MKLICDQKGDRGTNFETRARTGKVPMRKERLNAPPTGSTLLQIQDAKQVIGRSI